MALYRVLVLVGLVVAVQVSLAVMKETYYVKNNSTITLVCPYKACQGNPIMWRKSDVLIALGSETRNNSKKYSVTGNNNGEQNLQIVHFSQENIGEYECQGAHDGIAVSRVFDLNLCSIPHEISFFNLNIPDSSNGQEMNSLCKRATKKAPYIPSLGRIAKKIESEEIFTCDLLTNEQCLKAHRKITIQLFWNEDSSQTKCIVSAIQPNYFVTALACNCTSLKPTGDRHSDFFAGFYSEETLYLKNISMADITRCHCDVIPDGIHCKKGLFSKEKISHIDVVVCFILLLAVLCIFVCMGIYVHIRKAKKLSTRRICQNWNRTSAHNIINNRGDHSIFHLENGVNTDMAERTGNELEGYSSIDKRLVLGKRSQRVSYLSYSETSHEHSREASTKNQTNNDEPVDQVRQEELQLCLTINKTLTRQQNLPLNYIDVMFDSTQNTSTFYIRGDNNKTPYADIDFTLHAEHLPDIDSSEGNDGDSDDDFMSLSGIQNWIQPS